MEQSHSQDACVAVVRIISQQLQIRQTLKRSDLTSKFRIVTIYIHT
jgi:hypothetical protein